MTGGLPLHRYSVDFDLLEEYHELLGDWFLGFQLHEFGSNMRVEWNCLMREMGGGKGPFTVEEMQKKLKKRSQVLPPGSFNIGYLEEYANRVYTEDIQGFLGDMKELICALA